MYGHPEVGGLYWGRARFQFAENARTGVRATIRRGSAKARRATISLVNRDLRELEGLYRQAARDLTQTILDTVAVDGNVKITSLQGLLDGVNRRIQVLSAARNDLLENSMLGAARIGTGAFAGVSELTNVLAAVPHEAVQFVQSFVAQDGLKLSERLWRLDLGARRGVSEALQSAIIQGSSASQAALDFLERGVEVPDDIRRAINAANAGGLARIPGQVLMTGEGSPYDNARRLFRTEINRAQGEAYRAVAFENPDVIGTRFLLSPRHPRRDICDMHASVNRYGLGQGVYPKGRSPWPAHPNTLSFEVVVFADEVTAEDRAGKEDRIRWLKRQSKNVQEGVVGGRLKREALERGYLREGEIATPWRVLKKRYAKRGLKPEEWGGRSFPPPPVPPSRVLPDFRKTGSSRNAAQWARDKDLADEVNYSGAHVEVANAWNQSVHEHLASFPELRKGLQFIGTVQARNRLWYSRAIERVKKQIVALNPGLSPAMIEKAAKRYVKKPRTPGGVWAYSVAGGDVSGVTVNTKWARDPDRFRRSLRANVENGFHPPGGDTVKSVIDHELGHQMDDLTSAATNEQVRKLHKAWLASDSTGTQLSRYARTNIQEFIAEAWAEYRNAPNPRPVASGVAQLIIKLYEDKFGHA